MRIESSAMNGKTRMEDDQLRSRCDAGDVGCEKPTGKTVKLTGSTNGGLRGVASGSLLCDGMQRMWNESIRGGCWMYESSEQEKMRVSNHCRDSHELKDRCRFLSALQGQ